MAGAFSDAPTPVTIYGRTYNLRGSGDPGYLAQLAAEVDRRMRDVADATGTADTLKVAILAALNIADDYVQAKRGRPDAGVEEALGRLVRLLDDTLVEAGGRPNPGTEGRAE